MNRRSFVGGLSASAITATGSYVAFIQPADSEIEDLESQLGELDTRVDALETQVAEFSSEDEVEGPAESAPSAGSEGVTIEGSGTMVPDPFPLAEGRYRVPVTRQASNGYAFVIVEVIDPSGETELIFNQGGEASGEWSGSTIYNASEDGDYIVSVSNTQGPWTLAFEPF